MDSFDKSFIAEIMKRLKTRLGRDLTASELSTFSRKRSGMAYEMIMDYISDESKSREAIEEYVKNVVEEK